MEDQLISYETAFLANDKGFSEKTNNHYWDYTKKSRIPSPTQSLLAKWLREKFDIHIWVEVLWDEDLKQNKYEYTISSDLFEEVFDDNIIHDTYETALEEGLRECLKLI